MVKNGFSTFYISDIRWKFKNRLGESNDAAERAVKFGSDYNAVITHDLKRKADVMHLVEETRRECPKATKS